MITLWDEDNTYLGQIYDPELAKIYRDIPGLQVKNVLVITCPECEGKGFLELREEKNA